MKNNIKNIVAVVIISGLFFVPFLCSAQTGGGIVNDNKSLAILPLNNDKSQAEIEAVEEMLYLVAEADLQQLNVSDAQKTSSRMFTFISTVINEKSQAEVEAEEELQYIQTISALRQLNISDPAPVSSGQFTLISNLIATNYDARMSRIQNIR